MEWLFQKTGLESRRTWSKCFPNNFSIKWNRNGCLLNICYVTGTVLTVWHFISTYRVPARGFPLEGGWGKKAQMMHLLCSHSSQSGHPAHCQKVEILLMLLVPFFPWACLSGIPLLGHFLTIYFIFALLERLPSGSFDVYNACHHSVASHTLFAGVIFMQYVLLPSFFKLTGFR